MDISIDLSEADGIDDTLNNIRENSSNDNIISLDSET